MHIYVQCTCTCMKFVYGYGWVPVVHCICLLSFHHYNYVLIASVLFHIELLHVQLVILVPCNDCYCCSCTIYNYYMHLRACTSHTCTIFNLCLPYLSLVCYIVLNWLLSWHCDLVHKCIHVQLTGSRLGLLVEECTSKLASAVFYFWLRLAPVTTNSPVKTAIAYDCE